MNVPLLDLKAQYRSIQAEIDTALLRVVASQSFILGPEVEELERNIASLVGVSHAIGVSSGTDALLLSLMALGIGPGDGVIVPTFSFFATAGVVARLHAVPLFVDIDPRTYNIDPAKAVQALRKHGSGCRVKAIIPVHLFGQSAEMDPLMDFAAAHGLAVVEDAAQAIGARYRDGRRVGSIGTTGCFSFFPSKNLGAFGDGGVITTNDEELAHRMRIMRVHGAEKQYHHTVVGGNFRLDAIQAAILNVKLPHLGEWSRARKRNAEYYNRRFIEAGAAERCGVTVFDKNNEILLPASVYEDSGIPEVHIYNQYCIRVRNRDGLVQHLKGKGIGCAVYYPVPFHKQECFRDVPSSREQFPVSDAVSETILALPVYPELSDPMKDYVVETVLSHLRP
ncbi:MAG: DegT/DnrJ/EryC1/StrS family aminotransferase [Bacteroidota bacterium]|nr:DegT/DnrJ/EryC1/StrS family aminotransferase [Bacteroidota bacterium]